MRTGERPGPGHANDRGASPPRSDGALRNLCVLVASDDASSRLFLAETLAGAGAWVFTAADGLEAAGAGFPGRYDLVLADVTRPAADGLRLLQAFRRFAPRVRTVAVAGPAAVADDWAAATAAADAVLRAPYTPERLLAVARSALERDERQRPGPPPRKGAILGASRDPGLLHALQSICTLFGYVFVPAASAFDAAAALGEGAFRWVVVDEHLADGPGACLVESLPLYSRSPQAILVADRRTAEALRRGRPPYVVTVAARPDVAAALRRILAAA